jgi:hypothetical protein
LGNRILAQVVAASSRESTTHVVLEPLELMARLAALRRAVALARNTRIRVRNSSDRGMHDGRSLKGSKPLGPAVTFRALHTSSI